MNYIIFHAYFEEQTKEDGWTWLKFDGKPPEETRNAIKNLGFRWGRRKEAWYAREYISPDKIKNVLGEPLGTIDGRAPTKTWRYCMELVQLAMPGLDPVITKVNDEPKKSTNSNPKLALRFRDYADKMQAEIDRKREPMTQNPTPKRVKEYQSRLHDANNLERGQKALYTLADLHKNGNIPDCLQHIKFKKDVLPLVRTSWKSEGYYEGYDSGEYADTTEAGKMLQSLIGEMVDSNQSKIDRMEAKAILNVGNIPGFFPTPEDLAKNMVYMADIRDGDKVLEPSAGSGVIADAVRELHPTAKLDVVEFNYSLRELLEAKGHNLIGYDFLELNGDKWNAIVMNPPFEDLQDIDHVRHAYDLLADGGTLVAIMSESPFFRNTKKAQEFRCWLDDVGHYRQHLEAGALAPHTNVKANLIVIEK